jgi:hypothetical protein
MAMPGQTTIVTCVESGPLESQVLMLAESLRAFGGIWAGMDLIAVKPRRGPRISSKTLREFSKFNVEFIDERFNAQFDWWNNANKSAVMAHLEARVSTPHITWMDGDMIVLRELDCLLPKNGTTFVARAGEGYLGSNGDDENAPYWNKLCQLAGICFREFPEIISFPERRSIRAYWQAGLYTYLVDTRLGRAHYEIIKRLLTSQIASQTAGIYHQDQVSISLAVQKLKLAHSEYSARMNYNLNPLAKESAKILPISEINILHYHGSLYPSSLSWAMSILDRLPRDRLELIRKYVPLTANANLSSRIFKRILRMSRARKVRRFESQTISY